MIEASFERSGERSAAVSGAYQYDTGQRLRMHGLPSPQELAQKDDFLSGDMATMQVHFGLKGDSQTQARLALWEEDSQCWLTMIPDEYLQTSESVYAYIYVSYGLDEEGNGRTKTMYELVFKPISRPAPNNVATSEQWEAWATKSEETDLAIDALQSAQASAQAAQQKAQASAQEAEKAALTAQEAAQEAETQRQRLEAIQSQWEGMTVRTVSLTAGSEATADMEGSVLTLGLPRGADGAKGETGDMGPADIALSIADGVLTITPKA
ncbi:MAG: hypothetical protein IJ313_04465 [Clostridia bacterium]|nr:hypothetical protein [Clostridia bacterium]